MNTHEDTNLKCKILPLCVCFIIFYHILLNRDGGRIVFVGQSLQYHCDWQQWASVPEHAGSGGRQNNDDGNSCNCLHPNYFYQQLILITHHSTCFYRCWQRTTSNFTWMTWWQKSKVWMARWGADTFVTFILGFVLNVWTLWFLIHWKVKEVVLKSGKVIPTDVLIVGIGEKNSLLYSFLFQSLTVKLKRIATAVSFI